MNLKRIISLLLAMVLLLSTAACGKEETDDDSKMTIDPNQSTVSVRAADDVFSLGYDPDESMNPLRTKSQSNYIVDCLVYEFAVDLDSDYNQPIYAYAQEHGIPVAIHSYPSTPDDRSAVHRIVKVLDKYPELTVIVSHMGAHQWKQLLPTRAYVDISAILLDYVRTYGLDKTNQILRKFGADRLIFATDYPDSRILLPDEIYDSYFDVLNQMDFTLEEADKIVSRNILRIFGE